MVPSSRERSLETLAGESGGAIVEGGGESITALVPSLGGVDDAGWLVSIEPAVKAARHKTPIPNQPGLPLLGSDAFEEGEVGS